MSKLPLSEHSYGVIPLKREEQHWEVFLIQHRGAGHWAFPKGHPEEEESPEETARRELFEETGLHVKSWFPHPPLIETYHFTRQGRLVNKRVTYFIAEVEGEIHLHPIEISAGRWMPIAEAVSLITYAEGKKICLRVEKLLQQMIR